jgi:hypothetical protein
MLILQTADVEDAQTLLQLVPVIAKEVSTLLYLFALFNFISALEKNLRQT